MSLGEGFLGTDSWRQEGNSNLSGAHKPRSSDRSAVAAILASEHVQRPERATRGCDDQPRLTRGGENGVGHQRVRKRVLCRREAWETCEQRLVH